MSKMFFSDSWVLWVLAPVVILWVTAWFILRARGGWSRATVSAAVRFSSISHLKKLKPSTKLRLRRLTQLLRIATIILLALALARPQTGRKHTQVQTEGIDIVLAIDTSGSMQALDLDADRSIKNRRNRLQVVKSVVESFVEQRPNDQIGIVVFGEEAFTQCPLTLDHGIVATFLEQLEIGMAGDATAIGSALGTAVKRLKDSEAKSKVVVLLTDGRNTAGSISPTKAAEIAKTFGIKVYVVGAGTRGKAPFLVDGLFGKQPVYQDVQIDEETLNAIATITSGAYFRAEDEEGLSRIYEQINQLERTEIKSMSYLEYNEEFRLFVILALGLLLSEILLLGTWLKKIP